MFILFLICCYLIDYLESQTFCGIFNSTQPTLAIGVPSLQNAAGIDSRINARILTVNGWSDWEYLENDNCIEFELDCINYFSNFNDISDPWLLVSYCII